MEAVPCTRIHFVYLELFSLVEVALFSGSRAIQGKPFILVETTPFNGNRCFWQKSFYLVGIFLSGSHFVYLNSSLLLEAIPFNRSCYCQWKLFRLFGAVFLVAVIPFSGSHFVYLEPRFLVEVVSRSHFLQWKSQPFFSGNDFFFWACFILVESIPLNENYHFQWKFLIEGFYFTAFVDYFSCNDPQLLEKVV